MASLIKIKPGIVNNAIAGLNSSHGKLGSVTSNVSSVQFGVSYEIKNRNNIDSRLRSATASLHKLEERMNRIKSFTSDSLEKYQGVERYLNRQAANREHDLVKVLMDKHAFSSLYELYDQTVGRLEHLLHSAQYIGNAGLLHLLGWRFVNEGGRYTYKLLDSVKHGKYNLPIGSLISKVGNSKLNFLAKMMVSPYYAIKYANKSLAEVVYKKFTKYLPDDITKMTNSVRDFRHAISDARNLKEAANAVKSNAKSLGSAALKIGKGNAFTAFAITGVVEGVGAGIKITENYSKYSGDVETLKTENAKVVGEAVYKTAVVGGSSVIGAVALGAVGSLAGPGGTVVGAAVGGYIGSVVGEKLAKNTPGWVTDASVHFKDTIFKGTEAVAEGASKVKEGFSEVKKNASNLLENSKSFFGKLSFGG
ncbi:MAG: hypothetical protein ACQEV7_21170 [Bacillota bacterium]